MLENTFTPEQTIIIKDSLTPSQVQELINAIQEIDSFETDYTEPEEEHIEDSIAQWMDEVGYIDSIADSIESYKLLLTIFTANNIQSNFFIGVVKKVIGLLELTQKTELQEQESLESLASKIIAAIELSGLSSELFQVTFSEENLVIKLHFGKTPEGYDACFKTKQNINSFLQNTDVAIKWSMLNSETFKGVIEKTT